MCSAPHGEDVVDFGRLCLQKRKVGKTKAAAAAALAALDAATSTTTTVKHDLAQRFLPSVRRTGRFYEEGHTQPIHHGRRRGAA